VYPPCNTIAFTDDFEANNLTANNWTTFSGVESQVSLTNVNAIADTTSLQFEGGPNCQPFYFFALPFCLQVL
jgi:hypothetical protein